MERRIYQPNPELEELIVSEADQERIKTCKNSGGTLINGCEKFSCDLNPVCNASDKVKISLG